MTYDNWKSREPQDEPWGECNYCGIRLALTKLYLVKRDIWACEQCCGIAEELERDLKTAKAYGAAFDAIMGAFKK